MTQDNFITILVTIVVTGAIVSLFWIWIILKNIAKPPSSGLVVTAFYSEIPGILSSLNSNSMKQAQFKDLDAKDKVCILIAMLPKNGAGNFPDFKKETLRAETSNSAIATASASYNEETGEFRLKTKYSGLKGNVLTQLIFSPDVDGSGDPDISLALATTISTEEAKGFNEDEVVVSELQDDAE